MPVEEILFSVFYVILFFSLVVPYARQKISWGIELKPGRTSYHCICQLSRSEIENKLRELNSNLVKLHITALANITAVAN